MIRTILISVLLASAAICLRAQDCACRNWHPDISGPGFEQLTIRQKPDYSGYSFTTVVRRMANCPAGGRGVLYVHGFNDYFFQKEMADSFAAHGIDFYAVDLRRYGRSHRKGERQFDVRNIDEYYGDIDSALAVMNAGGITDVTLMGHSTGGLITASYMARKPSPLVKRLILNSPFLDWNLGKMEKWVWAVDLLGAVAPGVKISQGDSEAYSESLLRDRHGEWDYNTDWKLRHSPDVTAGWVRAIDLAQNYLHKHPYSIHVPILLMYSAQSYQGSEWSAEVSRSDAVLDVADIKYYGMRLSHDVHPVKVNGGLHDLMLSAPGVRKALYPVIFRWLGAPECQSPADK